MLQELRSLAAKAAEQFPDCQEGIRWILNQVDQMPDLKEALILPAIREAASEAYYRARHHARRELAGKRLREKKAPHTIKSKRGRKVIRMSQKLTFLASWTIGNKRLGDANRTDLAAAQEDHRARKRGHSERERFYAALQERLKNDNMIVRKVWSEQEAEALWDKIHSTKQKVAV